ncbi:MAG: stage II sporulation protein M [Lentisphaerae bacterium]|nr:stage II sporulation protein M [Lentisphaerota bacterium]
MIINIQRFTEQEKPHWDRLEALLQRRERDGLARMELPDIVEFHALYERAAADLARLSTYSGERDIRQYLEALVARAYGEVHETRRHAVRFRPLHWLTTVLPCTFRRHIRAFWLAVAVTLVGCVLGSFSIGLDATAKDILMPFPHLRQDPSQRVADEETESDNRMEGRKARGAAWYVTHNTKVAITTMALGVTWGVGTIVLLFTNGVMLGAVCADYAIAGETPFMVGWLLPHGSVEIPAIVLAGQAGLILALALIGWGDAVPLRQRLRRSTRDLMTIMGGVAILLAWAGFIESFLSQYHEPTIPYWVKIAFGSIQLLLLCAYLALAGRKHEKAEAE